MLVLLVSIGQVGVNGTSCPNSTAATDGIKPLYFLALVPMYLRTKISLLAAKIAQEEINNRSDILPGYHIELITEYIEVCSSSEAGIGLSKLVKYTVNPPCRPIVAVMGLGCSSHTSVISPVAGHKGFDLIQVSGATSPIFETRNQDFPHLWRIIGDANVYSDTVLAIMDQFSWTRIGIVYSTESSLYSELAKEMEQKIKESSNKTIAFNLGIRGTKAYYLDAVISNIKSSEIGVLVKMISQRQSSVLLSLTHQNGLVYPHYTWIHVLSHPVQYVDKDFMKYARGHIFLYVQFAAESKDTNLVSNQTFSDYTTKYRALYRKQLQPLFNISYKSVFVVTQYYDQVWTIALAVNNSLSELKNKNLSIDNYTIGQPEITAVIEEKLKNLKFQGASGWIEFNQYRSVPNPIEALWITNDEPRVKRVGLYNPQHPSDFYITLNASDLPSDTVPRVNEYILISLPVAIVLYTVTGCAIFFTTIQLVLYLVYRHHKVIKATSPFLSLLMFLGCYLFCGAAILLITFASFVLSPEAFTAMAITHFIFIINGISLILITLFIKLLRVFRIFICWSKDLGKQWNNLSLLIAILLLSIVPNIGLAVIMILKLPTHSTFSYYKFFKGNLPVIVIHTRIEPTSNYSLIGLAVTCIIVFLTLVFYMGVRNRKIKMKNFNSSGQVYLLLAVLVITICLAISIVIIFLVTGQESVANTVMVALLLIFAMASQMILFLPKILSAVFDEKFPKVLSCLNNVLSFIGHWIFQ